MPSALPVARDATWEQIARGLAMVTGDGDGSLAKIARLADLRPPLLPYDSGPIWWRVAPLVQHQDRGPPCKRSPQPSCPKGLDNPGGTEQGGGRGAPAIGAPGPCGARRTREGLCRPRRPRGSEDARQGGRLRCWRRPTGGDRLAATDWRRPTGGDRLAATD
ncbi:MAG: hypothetical protein WDW38_000321 [Sanguina aurantia]